MVLTAMNIVLWILGTIVALVAILAAVASTKPDKMELARSITINAPAERIYPLIANFRRWNDWSPWDKIDPNLERRFDGPEEGPGAHYAWTGNKKVGSGEMKILETTVPTRVLIELHFIVPFEATNSTEFTIKPVGAQSEVTWKMSGPSPLFMRMMGILFSMEKAISKDFDNGLSAMKRVAESS